MARRVPPELTEFLAPFSDDIQAIALALRKRVLAVMPDAHEFVWDATNAVSLVYAPGDSAYPLASGTGEPRLQ